VYLLNSVNAKVGMEGIFRSTIGTESLHEIHSDNGVRVVNFVTFKNVTVKVQCSQIVSFINLVDIS
jgi:hypothetical protein